LPALSNLALAGLLDGDRPFGGGGCLGGFEAPPVGFVAAAKPVRAGQQCDDSDGTGYREGGAETGERYG